MMRHNPRRGRATALATIAILLTGCSDDPGTRAGAGGELAAPSPSGDLVQATRLTDVASADTLLPPGPYAMGFSSDQADAPMVVIDVPAGYHGARRRVRDQRRGGRLPPLRHLDRGRGGRAAVRGHGLGRPRAERGRPRRRAGGAAGLGEHASRPRGPSEGTTGVVMELNVPSRHPGPVPRRAPQLARALRRHARESARARPSACGSWTSTGTASCWSSGTSPAPRARPPSVVDGDDPDGRGGQRSSTPTRSHPDTAGARRRTRRSAAGVRGEAQPSADQRARPVDLHILRPVPDFPPCDDVCGALEEHVRRCFDGRTCHVGDRHVQFLWLLPISDAERDWKVSSGLESLESRFDDVALRYWQVDRASVV